MLFSRTYRLKSSLPIEDIKRQLLGEHVKVHNLDFEVFEKDRMIKIIPHAEQVENIKTLPITHVELDGNGTLTQIHVTSKMRKIDKGGPMLIVSFCFFMILAAVLMFQFGKDEMTTVYPATVAGIAVLIFIVFWLRMESGYFDYVRKIRDFIKSKSAAA